MVEEKIHISEITVEEIEEANAKAINELQKKLSGHQKILQKVISDTGKLSNSINDHAVSIESLNQSYKKSLKTQETMIKTIDSQATYAEELSKATTSSIYKHFSTSLDRILKSQENLERNLQEMAARQDIFEKRVTQEFNEIRADLKALDGKFNHKLSEVEANLETIGRSINEYVIRSWELISRN